MLQLSKNEITGVIPSNICDGGKLEKIELSGNTLIGTIPDLSGCTKLMRLHLTDNAIGGDIPASLGNLTNLSKWLCFLSWNIMLKNYFFSRIV